jgi:integrase
MLIVMKPQAREEDIRGVCRKIEAMGFRAHAMPGAQRTAIGITGNPGPLEPAEFETLPGVAHTSFLYASGMRLPELRGLNWRDLSATANGGQVTVPGKRTKTRSIRLPQSVWKLLTALGRGGEAGDPVFVSRKKKPLSIAQACRIVRAATRRAGIELNVSRQLASTHARLAHPRSPRADPFGASHARPRVAFDYWPLRLRRASSSR